MNGVTTLDRLRACLVPDTGVNGVLSRHPLKVFAGNVTRDVID